MTYPLKTAGYVIFLLVASAKSAFHGFGLAWTMIRNIKIFPF